MALLTSTTTTAHGVVLPAAQAVSASDTFANTNGRTLLEVTNGNAAPTTVTFTPVNTYNIATGVTYTVAPDAQTVTNGTSKVFGPFNTGLFGTGTITVTFSVTATVTARVIELGLA